MPDWMTVNCAVSRVGVNGRRKGLRHLLVIGIIRESSNAKGRAGTCHFVAAFAELLCRTVHADSNHSTKVKDKGFDKVGQQRSITESIG